MIDMPHDPADAEDAKLVKLAVDEARREHPEASIHLTISRSVNNYAPRPKWLSYLDTFAALAWCTCAVILLFSFVANLFK